MLCPGLAGSCSIGPRCMGTEHSYELLKDNGSNPNADDLSDYLLSF